MDHIETAILNCYGIREAEQNMVFAARLTQHGHTIQSMADLMDLYHQSYSQKTDQCEKSTGLDPAFILEKIPAVNGSAQCDKCNKKHQKRI